jgi:VCBS repeat-containing protein
MNSKHCLLLVSLLVPPFANAYVPSGDSWNNQVLLAEDKVDQQDAINSFYALNDYGTIVKKEDESGLIPERAELTGDVLINDEGMQGGVSVKLISPNISSYGTAYLFGDGTFTYNLNYESLAIKNLHEGDQALTDRFTYQVQTVINNVAHVRTIRVVLFSSSSSI